MKLSHHLLRCHHGRKDQKGLNSKVEAEEEEVAMNHHMAEEEVMTMGATTVAGEEAMTMGVTTAEGEEAMIHMEDEEVTNKGVMTEEGEEDVAVMTMEAEGEEEETNSKEAGQMEEVAIRTVATGIATTEMQVFKQVAIMVVVADTKEVATAVISLHIQEVDTRVVAVAATNRTTDTKMVGPTVIEEVGVEEGEVAVEVVVAVEAKEEAGEAEVDRTLIKGGSLSSTSNMEAISITSLDLDKEDTLLAEATKVYTSAELK